MTFGRKRDRRQSGSKGVEFVAGGGELSRTRLLRLDNDGVMEYFSLKLTNSLQLQLRR